MSAYETFRDDPAFAHQTSAAEEREEAARSKRHSAGAIRRAGLVGNDRTTLRHALEILADRKASA